MNVHYRLATIFMVLQEIKDLIQNLKNDDSETFSSTVNKLKHFGEAAVIELINTFKNSNDTLRNNAVFALSEITDPKAIKPLIEIMTDYNENVIVRANIALILWLFDDFRTIEPLINALNDQNWEVRANAASSLGNLGNVEAQGPLVRLLNDENQQVRYSAAKALGDLGDKAATEALISSLNDSDNDERWIFTEALGAIGDERATEPLINALDDQIEEVRVEASKALVMIGSPAIPSLYNLLRKNRDSRLWAVVILSNIKDERVIDALKIALQDEDSIIREKASKAIEELQHKLDM